MKPVISHSSYWEKFSQFVDEKTLRERVIILLIIVALIYGAAE